MPTPPIPLVLASASPRRRALLAEAGVACDVQPGDVPEERSPGEAPAAFATRLAQAKARATAERLPPHPLRFVLGADTIVVLGDQVLGKPESPEHAVELLGRLVGRRHRVLTAVAVLKGTDAPAYTTVVESRVTLHPATRDELERYVATGEPLDKAGAYALQGAGRRFVARVEGSESNVIGLPLEETLALLRAAGWQPG